MKKSIFKQGTQTQKLIFTTPFTAFPAIKNQHYPGEIDGEVNMDKLFKPDWETKKWKWLFIQYFLLAFNKKMQMPNTLQKITSSHTLFPGNLG